MVPSQGGSEYNEYNTEYGKQVLDRYENGSGQSALRSSQDVMHSER
jgi:hypothetical protein